MSCDSPECRKARRRDERIARGLTPVRTWCFADGGGLYVEDDAGQMVHIPPEARDRTIQRLLEE